MDKIPDPELSEIIRSPSRSLRYGWFVELEAPIGYAQPTTDFFFFFFFFFFFVGDDRRLMTPDLLLVQMLYVTFGYHEFPRSGIEPGSGAEDRREEVGIARGADLFRNRT